LGNPLDFILTPGQAHDLEGADALLPDMAAEALLADKAFDADERVIEPLLARGKSIVIPPKTNRKVQRDFDKDAYKARHLIENFFCKLKQYRAIAILALCWTCFSQAHAGTILITEQEGNLPPKRDISFDPRGITASAARRIGSTW
jgi:transposase